MKVIAEAPALYVTLPEFNRMIAQSSLGLDDIVIAAKLHRSEGYEYPLFHVVEAPDDELPSNEQLGYALRTYMEALPRIKPGEKIPTLGEALQEILNLAKQKTIPEHDNDHSPDV